MRDLATRSSAFSRVYAILLTLIAALSTAIAYGVGGTMTAERKFPLASLVVMVMLLNRVYGPINKLSNTQVNVFTALVAFDRVFEVLDLRPLVAEAPRAYPLPYSSGGAPDIEFRHVSFRYPRASEGLDRIPGVAGAPAAERAAAGWNLRGVSFVAAAGQVTALVGPPHLFHDSIRANLAYARPDVSEREMIGGLRGGACVGRHLHAAQWPRHRGG